MSYKNSKWVQTEEMCGHSKKAAIHKRPQEKLTLLAPWSQISSLQNHEPMDLHCLSHPVGDILLWESKQANTKKLFIKAHSLSPSIIVDKNDCRSFENKRYNHEEALKSLKGTWLTTLTKAAKLVSEFLKNGLSPESTVNCLFLSGQRSPKQLLLLQ